MDFPHIDVNSASEAQVASEPVKENIRPYIKEAGPPLINPSCSRLESYLSVMDADAESLLPYTAIDSQDASSVVEKATKETLPKIR